MDLSRVIEELQAAGLSGEAIAERLKTKGVDASQPTISRIKTGKITNPSFKLGMALLELHREVCSPRGRLRSGKNTHARKAA